MQMRFSQLDNKTPVLYVEHGDTGQHIDILKTRGLGFAVYGPDVELPFAVVDTRILDEPGYTEDHILAIEAHELGHIHKQSDDEPTAERAGIALLEAAGEEAAAQLLRERGII